MISSSEYKFISDRIGESQSVGWPMGASILRAKQKLQANDLNAARNPEKTQLSGIFDDTYAMVVINHIGAVQPLQNAVRALQSHIEKQYDTIDDYLLEKGIRVNPEFAKLSESLGYKISIENIE